MGLHFASRGALGRVKYILVLAVYHLMSCNNYRCPFLDGVNGEREWSPSLAVSYISSLNLVVDSLRI